MCERECKVEPVVVNGNEVPRFRDVELKFDGCKVIEPATGGVVLPDYRGVSAVDDIRRYYPKEYWTFWDRSFFFPMQDAGQIALWCGVKDGKRYGLCSLIHWGDCHNELLKDRWKEFRKQIRWNVEYALGRYEEGQDSRDELVSELVRANNRWSIMDEVTSDEAEAAIKSLRVVHEIGKWAKAWATDAQQG